MTLTYTCIVTELQLLRKEIIKSYSGKIYDEISLGAGICFILSSFYFFIAVAKFGRGEPLSCLFESIEDSSQTHQALELKRSTSCQIWQLNEKSHVSMQDSYFVVKEELNKERVENDKSMK